MKMKYASLQMRGDMKTEHTRNTNTWWKDQDDGDAINALQF